MTVKQFEMMRAHLSPSERVRLDERSRTLAWQEIRCLLDDVNLKNIQYNHLKKYEFVQAAFEFASVDYIVNGIDKLLMLLVKLIERKYITLTLKTWDAIIDIDCVYVERGYRYGEKVN